MLVKCGLTEHHLFRWNVSSVKAGIGLCGFAPVSNILQSA